MEAGSHIAYTWRYLQSLTGLKDLENQTAELFTLTYGALVANIVRDFDTDAEINEQLDKIGFNIGLKLVEDYLARGNPGRCNDFKETAEAVVKGFKIFLGITPTICKFSSAGDEFTMALNPQYSHTTTPIIEAWLIKALRLVHSKKSSDRDKLRKFYKEACENEAQVVHMTIAEALREPQECITTNYESNDRDTSTSTHSTQRTRVAQSVNDPSQSTSSSICTTTSNNIVTNESMSSMNTNSSGTSMFTTTSTSNPDQIISSTTTATTNNNITSGIPTSPVIGTTTHSSNSTTNRANKRNKVAFFNIFDVASSTPNNSSISNTPIVSKNNTAQRSLNQLDNTLSIESVDFSNTTIRLCTISSINDDNQEITTDSVIGNTGTTNNIPMHSNLSNPIIDLTFTDNETASISSSLAINTTTSANTVAVTLPLSEDKQMATGKVMNPPTVNTTTTSTIITTPTTYIPTVSSVSLQPPSLSSVVTVIGALTKSTQDNSSFNTNTTTTNNNNNARLLAASLVADLVCRLCGRLSQQPQLEPDNKTLNANVLVECIKCGSLYHQLCHQPLILMSTPKQQWLCINCSITTTTNTTIFNPSFVSSVSSLTSSISCTATSSSNSSLTTLAISANSTCVNSMSADPMIPCSVIQSDGDILSKDVTMITDNNNNNNNNNSNNNNEYSFSSSTHHSSVVLSNPVHFQSRETTSTVITPQTSSLPVCTSTSATTNISITTASSTTSASTVNVGARKRKPAFTSSLSGLPRKLKDDYN
ncbi:Trafficking protein particle complex subunit 3 [Schistosoma haematobium]|uniref:Trafficking protein particle complex subunit 3 n=1 Tax=Schistosoma haematobium TaxID=6185 RepID=A0A095BWA6_SCHHA|nr:Trafficking protein particle complex subunit 3 [Schistosoma haematobium]KAH9581406.1 Trafficking protein particle complex subunit 3 [Schistosoma haematobium]